jgi:class 3 adenylate cyclase
MAQEKYEEALSVAEQNIATFSKDISKIDLTGAYTQKANIYYALITANNQRFLDHYFRGSKLEALKAARKIVDSALHLQVEAGQVANMNELYKTRSNIRRLQGDFKGALEDFMQYKTLNDSIYNIERNNEVTQKTMLYEFEKKEAATREEQLRKDIRARNIRNSIAAGLAISILFGGIVYRQRNKISQAKKRSEELLLNILPADVVEELKVKGHTEAKMMDEVTILFTDFKGFTALAQHLTPKQLVDDINECFSAFDLIMERHGIEKIKTIGDSYMAAGGLPVPNTTHATDVVNAAIEIQQFMLAYKEKKEAEGKHFFEIRIGINSGPVVAGIVGIKKFSFDIWGDSVNTASRMESSGEAGKINISKSTYDQVKEHFRCKPRGKIQAKGKGEIEMYFVEGRT